MGLIGASIERGDDHRSVWEILGISPPTTPHKITPADLYPDALDCLRAAKQAGFIVGIAGNQPTGAVDQLRVLDFSADFVASSAEWNVSKPSTEFFSRLTRAAQLEAHQVMYIGDRIDNDILPAKFAGLRTALIRRGPWGYIHARRPEAELADLQLNSLAELTLVLDRHGG